MNELIMPHNVGVKNALENMKELLVLSKYPFIKKEKKLLGWG